VRDAGRRLPVGGKGNGAVAPSALLHLETRTLLTRRISERDLILAISLQLALDVHQRVEQMAGQLPPDDGGHQSSSVAISRNQRVEQMAGQLPPLRRKVKGMLVAERPVELTL